MSEGPKTYGDIRDQLTTSAAQRMALDHTADAMAYSMQAPPRRVVKPVDVPCAYCGADAGNPCLRWRRTRHGKVRKPRPHYHPSRVYDARIATEAVNALNPL